MPEYAAPAQAAFALARVSLALRSPCLASLHVVRGGGGGVPIVADACSAEDFARAMGDATGGGDDGGTHNRIGGAAGGGDARAGVAALLAAAAPGAHVLLLAHAGFIRECISLWAPSRQGRLDVLALAEAPMPACIPADSGIHFRTVAPAGAVEAALALAAEALGAREVLIEGAPLGARGMHNRIDDGGGDGGMHVPVGALRLLVAEGGGDDGGMHIPMGAEEGGARGGACTAAAERVAHRDMRSPIERVAWAGAPTAALSRHCRSERAACVVPPHGCLAAVSAALARGPVALSDAAGLPRCVARFAYGFRVGRPLDICVSPCPRAYAYAFRCVGRPLDICLSPYVHAIRIWLSHVGRPFGICKRLCIT